MKQGYDKIPIRTVDTAVVVLAVTSAHRLNITELWIAFGARKNFRYLPAHEMASAPLRYFANVSCLHWCHVLEAGANGLYVECRMTKSYQLSVLWLLPRRS